MEKSTQELNAELVECKADNERLYAVLRKMDGRVSGMMPRSQMARLAQDALDGAEDSADPDTIELLMYLINAIDSGELRRSRMSSGMDYVIYKARNIINK